MDLVTQGLLGAVVGQVGFYKTLGKRSILWGGIIGLLPDIDVIITKFSTNILSMEIIHRGITHSIFFAALLALPLGFLIHKLEMITSPPTKYFIPKDRIKTWAFLCYWSLITHPLLDLFTSFGTQLLSPFTNHRFALHAIPIIDPVYSIPLVLSIIAGLIFPKKNFIISSFSLFMTSAYLLLGIIQHDKALAIAQDFCAKNNLQCSRIEAFPLIPTIFAQRLWVETNSAIYVTEYSTWSNKIKPWIHQSKIKIPDDIQKHPSFKTYNWFTRGVITTKINQIYGFCIIDSRYGSLSYQPFGKFCICFKDNQIFKNINHDETLETSHHTLQPKTSTTDIFKFYIDILKKLCVWTFYK